jgi:hypothetical protein
MALLFPVLAGLLVRPGPLGRRRIAAISAALVCALYTKQTNVFYVVWIFVFVARQDRRSGALLALTTVIPSAVLLAALVYATRGWFWIWLVDQSSHPFRPITAWGPALFAFAKHNPLLVVLPLFAAALRRGRLLHADTAKWLGMLVAAFAASLLPYAKEGGWFNVLIPVYVLSWPVVFMVVSDLARAIPGRSAPLAIPLGVASLTTYVLAYDPAPHVPSVARLEGARRLHTFVHELPGSVAFTTSPFLPILEGKTTATQPAYQGYIDAELAGLAPDYADALDQSGADYVIVIARPGKSDYRAKLATKFERLRDVDFAFEPVPWPPASIWRRRAPR